MSFDQISVEGTVHSDGTLELDEKLRLPAGRVRVTVQAALNSRNADPKRFLAMMESIWADQESRGHVRRSREEIDDEINKLRDESEEELQAVERLHEECQKMREQIGK